MAAAYLSCKVHYLNDASGNNIVSIDFFNDLGAISEQKEYKLVSPEEIYERIEKGEEIHLDKSYVKNFSLNEYRKRKGLPERDYVALKNFTAIDAFIDCDYSTDFSFSKFEGGEVLFSKCKFSNGNLSFYKTQFGKGNIDFSDAFFGKGNIDFQFSEIEKGDFTLENAKFCDGLVSFVNINFGDGKINFKDVDFGKGKVDFHYSRFGKGAKTFDKCVFGQGDVDFRRVEFGGGRVDFKRVDFGDGNVYFDETEFKDGKVNFKSSVFGNGSLSFIMVDFGTEEANFENVEFGEGTVTFERSKANVLSFRESHFNNYFDLRVASCKKIDLSETIIRDIVDFRSNIHKVEIEQLVLIGMRNLGRVFLDWKKNDAYNLIASQSEASDSEKAVQFRILKEDFRNNGQYDDEDKAYVAFKRFELKDEKKKLLEKHPKGAFWVMPLIGFQKLVFDRMGLYATAPMRVFSSMFIVYCVFSLLYVIIPLISDARINCPGEVDGFLGEVGNTFYFSAITFLTIGYGDCLPSGGLKWLSPTEGWVGVFMMSYFTVAFVRKILR